MFRDIPDHEAEATVDAAWEHGTRFFDTAPMYGAGLAEIRLGKYLAQHDRDDYVLSTKVGRLVLDEIDTDERDSEMFKFGLDDRIVYDYTEKGALKSIEDNPPGPGRHTTCQLVRQVQLTDARRCVTTTPARVRACRPCGHSADPRHGNADPSGG
jgi:hypothetical protein